MCHQYATSIENTIIKSAWISSTLLRLPYPQYFVVFGWVRAYIRNSRFPLSQNAWQRKSTIFFYFCPLKLSVLLLLFFGHEFSWQRLGWRYLPSWKLLFKSRQGGQWPKNKKKNENEKKNKNSKSKKKKTFLINCLALHLPWQLGNFGYTQREGSKIRVDWFSSQCAWISRTMAISDVMFGRGIHQCLGQRNLELRIGKPFKVEAIPSWKVA